MKIATFNINDVNKRLAIGDVGGDAIPIPFDLVHPSRADRWLLDKGRQARPDPLRQRLVEEPGLARVAGLRDDGTTGGGLAR